MSIKVRMFHPALQSLLGNPTEVRCEGATVGECLGDLTGRHPDAERLLFDSRGNLLSGLYVFVNMEGMFKADLTKPVADGDELIIAVLATGG